MMWYWGAGFPWWGWLIGLFAMVLFWGVVIWAVFSLVTALGRRPDEDRRRRGRDAMAILDERLARGEIDAEEYRRLRAVLRGEDLEADGGRGGRSQSCALDERSRGDASRRSRGEPVRDRFRVRAADHPLVVGALVEHHANAAGSVVVDRHEHPLLAAAYGRHLDQAGKPRTDPQAEQVGGLVRIVEDLDAAYCAERDGKVAVQALGLLEPRQAEDEPVAFYDHGCHVPLPEPLSSRDHAERGHQRDRSTRGRA
jgi:putative membrane protein